MGEDSQAAGPELGAEQASFHDLSSVHAIRVVERLQGFLTGRKAGDSRSRGENNSCPEVAHRLQPEDSAEAVR